jgi:hypothetical protein
MSEIEHTHFSRHTQWDTGEWCVTPVHYTCFDKLMMMKIANKTTNYHSGETHRQWKFSATT